MPTDVPFVRLPSVLINERGDTPKLSEYYWRNGSPVECVPCPDPIPPTWPHLAPFMHSSVACDLLRVYSRTTGDFLGLGRQEGNAVTPVVPVLDPMPHLHTPSPRKTPIRPVGFSHLRDR